MKALALWQPWASLVAIGAKRIETRHWEAPADLIGQRVAIHATKGHYDRNAVELEPFRRRLDEARDEGRLALVDDELPLGAIVATVQLARCSRMTRASIRVLEESNPDERAFGFYNLDRYAWVLLNVKPFTSPIPFTGRQGIFDVPDELLGHTPAQRSIL